MASFNLLRKWRLAWLPTTAIIGFMLIYALTVGGIAIILNIGYPTSLPMPQNNAGAPHKANFMLRVERSMICPGLLYFYRISSVNTMTVSLTCPANANKIEEAKITELEISFSDGRKKIYASAEKPLIKSVNGNTVQFEIETAELKKSNITIQGKGFFKSTSGEKTIFHIFQNMKYRSKLRLHPKRSLKNNPLPRNF